MPDIADAKRLVDLEQKINDLIDKSRAAGISQDLVKQPNEEPRPGYRPNYMFQEGECLRLAVASELGVPSSDIPYIGATVKKAKVFGSRKANKTFWVRWAETLLDMGYFSVLVPGRPSETDDPHGIDGYWIAGVPGEDSKSAHDINHAVVMKDGRVHYDPNPNPLTNLEGKTVDQAQVGSQFWIWPKRGGQGSIDILIEAMHKKLDL